MGEVQNEKDIKTGFLWDNPISEFFWICAGVNRPVIRQCPTEWAKYAGIGGTILFTALMAMLSGGYALYTVFDDMRVAAFFGVFWGLLIFNLDRFIVNTMYSDGKATISLMELVSGLPRIIMAIFLGIVISTPLELKIFEDEINVTIGEMKAQKIKEYRALDESKRDSLRNKLNQLQNSSPGDGIFGGENEGLQDENEQISKDIEYKNNEIKVLASKKRNEHSALSKLKHQLASCYNKQDSSKINTKINYISKNIRGIDSQISKLTTEINSLKMQVSGNTNVIKDNRKAAIQSWLSQIESVKVQITELDSVLSGGAVREYEELVNKQYGGFQAHLSAFNKMKEENSATRISALFIMLLFVIIETAPTFFKMMLEDGPYDDMLRAEEHKIKILADKRISDINDEVNTAVSISTKRNENQLQQQILANQELLKQLSKAQSEVLAEAIELWKKNELEKVRANPEDYISMESPKK